MSGEEIFIVDDLPGNLKVLNEILKAGGYSVRIFQEAIFAFEAALENPPDLFLIDIFMPELDGYELCRKLKNTDITAEIPVIFLTAANSLEEKLKAFDMGGVDFITKPYQSIEVLARVKTHLKLRALQMDLLAANADLEKRIEARTRDLEMKHWELQKANSVRENFLANISHELRTPIHGVSGMLDLLNSMNQPDSSGYFLDMAVAAMNNLSSILLDILSFSDIDSGRMKVMTEPIDLKELIENVANIFESKIVEKDLRINIEGESPNPFYGDKARISQILEKLLSNAVKFSEHGTITIYYDISNGLTFRIVDSGIGIDPSRFKEIFEPFQQLEDPYTKKYPGVGLGLAIVKKLVELLNGTIYVKSEEGEGTTFTVFIPESKETGSQKSSHKSPGQSPEDSISDIKILVAEDSAINRLWIRNVLRERDYKIFEACNGKEAVEIAQKEIPDIIFMDIGMPVLNGMDATKQIKSMDGLSSIPIVAVTAHTHEDDIRKFIEAGVNDYIPKPYRKSEIYSMIKKYIP